MCSRKKNLYTCSFQFQNCHRNWLLIPILEINWTHPRPAFSMTNSLAPGRPGCHFRTAIFNLVLSNGIFISSNDTGNALRWMPWDLTDDKSILVQVMAWCCQATSHYLSHYLVPCCQIASPGHNEFNLWTGYYCQKSGLNLNFQGHLSRQTSEIENLPVLHKMTPVRAIIYMLLSSWLLTCPVGQVP